MTNDDIPVCPSHGPMTGLWNGHRYCVPCNDRDDQDDQDGDGDVGTH